MPSETDTNFDPGTIELGADARFGLGLAQAGQNALKNLWDFIKVPGDVASGKYSLDEIKDLAPGYALGLASAGTPVGAATIPENSLGIFGGTKSLSASLRDLAKAQKLERQGKPAENILSNSGWFRGADNKWRNTISDEGASLNPNAFRQSDLFPEINSLKKGQNYTLSDVLNHPNLFSAYPELKEYKVAPSSSVYGYSGSFNPYTKTIDLSGGKDPLSVLLHETQHGVQYIEGFSPGGSPREFFPEGFTQKLINFEDKKDLLHKLVLTEHKDIPRRDIDALLFDTASPIVRSMTLKKLKPHVRDSLFNLANDYKEIDNINKSTMDKYTRLSGEVEARAVQEQLERRDWTTPVWQHEGYIPFEEQILKKPHRLVPVDYDPFVGVDQR